MANVPACLTETQRQQKELEEKVSVFLRAFASGSGQQHSVLLELWRDEHVKFLLKGLEALGPSYCVLDANRPWLCYWIVHSLALLGEPIDLELGKHMINFLSRCQDPHGGYGGGPGQMPHLATTYAAICALVTIGGNEALTSINRDQTLEFLLQMKDPSGGFRMHKNGEMDVRGCYTAIAVAHILDLLRPALVDGLADYIVSCQTHEGGIGSEPGSEAHGGYTYCGLAALALINQAYFLDLPRLLNWAVFRQGKVEGGFQGRVNKLVDGCYSFWQGGIFPLIQRLTQHVICQQALVHRSLHTNLVHGKATYERDEEMGVQKGEYFHRIRTSFPDECQVGPLFNTQALQGYILLCCQVLDGGLRDKPGKLRDFYHTCYCLSGLSTAQYCSSKRLGTPPVPSNVLGPFDNLLEATHPLCNVVLGRYTDAQRVFTKLSIDDY